MPDIDLTKSSVDYLEIIAGDLSIKKEQVANTYDLLKNGATIPFIARYRKEKTHSLDEEKLRIIQEKTEYFVELEERKISVIRRIEAQGKLTPELKADIEGARQKVLVEDLYQPYKFKKKSRAGAAREAGLEPLARIFEKQEAAEEPEALARPFCNSSKGIKIEADAIKGAMDILAEELSENAVIKERIRNSEKEKALLTGEVKEKFKDKPSKYEMYYHFSEKVKSLPSHRILGLRRAEKEGYIKTSITMDDEDNLKYIKGRAIKDSKIFQNILSDMVEDAYSRLLRPSIESEIRRELKIEADKEAARVFQKNLKDVLLAPPAGNRVVLGVDPGFKSGTKLAVIEGTGKFLEHHTIYPLAPQKEEEASRTILSAMIESFKIEIIAIGNGTASREIDEFITGVMQDLEHPPIKVVASEAGASIYSASPLARKEFPKLDVTIRGAISIARRVQDPLAELVKIEPKSIGVGQYQHDVNQTDLKKKLEQTVESCVNSVGIDINTASEPLLAYVSGINKTLAKSLINYRQQKGAFKSRSSMVKVPHFGPKAFEQAAGFLRVFNSDNPLDGTAVHPECYEVVTKICAGEKTELKDLIRNAESIRKIKLKDYVTDEVGLPTLKDIITEMEKPNRDPRKKFAYAKFNPDITKISDLVPETWVEGVVTNVTDFGIFVDIGVHQDGLVHISEVADRYVSDLNSYISTGDVVKTRVLSADPDQKRISLSMKDPSRDGKKPGRRDGKAEKRKSGQARKPRHATIDQLKKKYSKKGKQTHSNVKLKFSIKSIMKSGR
ncbi:Tex family protein [Fibrobacterota bacterium]